MKKNIALILVTLIAVQFGWSQNSKVLPELKAKITTAASELEIFEPSNLDPVSLNGTIVWSADKSQFAIIMKANILETWHIYAYVPSTQPFISSELNLELPEGVTKIGGWEKPNFEPYQDGIYVYKGELVFVQYCLVDKGVRAHPISCGLYYQSCDPFKCFPPKTKTLDLKM